MNNFRTSPPFLGKAYHIDINVEPYERIKLITAMAVSSLHQNISFKRAFNPILGETYEGYLISDTDGAEIGQDSKISRGETMNYLVKRTSTLSQRSQPTNLRSKFINIYVEQTSHHPPITNFLLEHIDGLYKIYGHYEEEFRRGSSTHEFLTKGPTYIEFKDRDKYLLTWPSK